MTIGLFKKKYTVRRHSPQTYIEEGYAQSPYTDFKVLLNVQPLSSDELQALPEGDKTVKRIKSFGPDMLTSADECAGVKGDLLYYRGRWYECTSSVLWDHTILQHFRSEFVIAAQFAQETAPVESEPKPDEEVGADEP